MDTSTYIVVADKFLDFTVNDRTLTVSQFKALASLPRHLQPERARLLLGQGISDDERAGITAMIEASEEHRVRWDIGALHGHRDRASASLSHKRKPCNTLIGLPVALGDDTFKLDLFIDQNCELMEDHQTGQHVQGMILVEAARQAFLAVTEEFYLKGANDKSYFVINEMSTSFFGFVFPLPAHMEYRVLLKDINERRQRFNVEIDLIQVGEIRTRTAFSFTAYPNEVISQKEASLAVLAAAFVRGAPGLVSLSA